jgi:GT2 family glycosyltransferase
MPMDQPEVTIAVVPRERFNMTARSLESIYRTTDSPFKLVYIDGGSPKPVRIYLQDQSQKRGFELIRKDRYLSGNQARNLALNHVDTKYVLFVDNDVVVAPGWLAALVQCAEETGAWIVGPTYCIGEPEFRTVHMVGGTVQITEAQGRRDLKEHHRFISEAVEKIHPALRRGPTGLVEFHAMLVRTQVFEKIGDLDEQLLSSPEHLDICLMVARLGGEIYLEPGSLINYLSPPPLARSDLSFFMLRWSDEWNRKSLEHFRKKWELADDSAFIDNHLRWLTAHRQLITIDPAQNRLRNLVGWRIGTRIGRDVLNPAERAFNHWWVRRLAKSSVFYPESA